MNQEQNTLNINNLSTGDDIQKQENINLKQKTTLYKIFIIFSVLICIFLLPFVNSMTSKFPSAYPGNEASSGGITSEIANQIAVYVWPILIVYLIMLIMLIIKKTNYRKVYYPLSLVTLTIIFFNLGIIYSGYMILWFLIILLPPLITLTITLSIIGNKLDNHTITKKTVGIILGSVLLIILITPIIMLLPNFIEYKTEDNIYNNDKIEEQQNNKLKTKENELKEEFNNLIDSNFISVNILMLNGDYTIDNIKLLIATDGVPDNEIDFCNELIKTYNNIKVLLEEYNYLNQTINFTFTNKNPFAKETSTFYQDGGYIRDWGTSYLVYLNPNPLEINK